MDEERGRGNFQKFNAELDAISWAIDKEEKIFKELCAKDERRRELAKRESKRKGTKDEGGGDMTSSETETDTDEELMPTVALGKVLVKSILPKMKKTLEDYRKNPQRMTIEDVRYQWANTQLQVKVGKQRFQRFANMEDNGRR